MLSINTLLTEPVFAISGREYCWRDVVAAARRWGAWTAVEADTRRGIACDAYARASGSHPDPEEILDAVTEFRYDHNLISADETEEWLRRWGLTIDDLTDYVRRALLRARWSDRTEELLARFPAGEEEVARHLKVEATCSGALARLARELAGRAAMADWEAEVHANGAGRDGDPLARVDALYERACERVLTPRALRAEIDANYLEWLRVDCHSVSFPTEDVAREAVVCVREDGMDLGEVAAVAGRPLSRDAVYLDQVVPSLGERLRGAARGELVGPVNLGDEYFLFWIADKTPPSEHDPTLCERARQAVVRRATEHEVTRRVRWRRSLGD